MKKGATILLAAGILLMMAGPALAAIPDEITFQGRILQNGSPVTGFKDLHLELYTASSGGTLLWTEDQTVECDGNGIYTVQLGSQSAIPASLFIDNDSVWLQVTVDGPGGTALSPRQLLSLAPYARRADRLDGYDSSDFVTEETDPTVDEAVKDGVAWGEIGAMPAGFADGVDNVGEGSASDWSEITGIPAGFADGTDDGITTETDPTVAASVKDGVAWSEIGSRPAGLDDGDDVGVSQAYVDALETRIEALENLLANVTRVGNDITFSGANLHIVNGTGTTGGAVNGLGNLVVGYNELRGTGDDRTGSHNMVVGKNHNYSSYGGLVAGLSNTISGGFASVGGGQYNEASGDCASVSFTDVGIGLA